MVTPTDDGLEYVADLIFDSVTTIALGTGSAPEQQSNTALASEEYRQSVGASNVSIVDIDGPVVLYQIVIKGGTQIAGGVTLHEIGLFADATGNGSADTCVVRDTFGASELTTGRFSTFQIKLPVASGVSPSSGGSG